MKENYKSSLTLQSKTNKSLDMDKVAEYLNNKKLKEERLREIQNEINRKQRVKDLDFDSMNMHILTNILILISFTIGVSIFRLFINRDFTYILI